MKIRKVIVIQIVVASVLLGFEGISRAEQTGPAGAVDVSAELTRANRMRVSGLVLSVIGFSATAVGASFMIVGAVEDSQEDPAQPTMGGAFAYIGGGIALGSAVTFLAIGLPLWLVGSARRSRLTEAVARLPTVTFCASRDQRAYSFGLSWTL